MRFFKFQMLAQFINDLLTHSEVTLTLVKTAIPSWISRSFYTYLDMDAVFRSKRLALENPGERDSTTFFSRVQSSKNPVLSSAYCPNEPSRLLKQLSKQTKGHLVYTIPDTYILFRQTNTYYRKIFKKFLTSCCLDGLVG